MKFLRSDTFRHLRLGKKRRKLQKWRAPRGRHNKLRKKRAGHPATPSIGYGTPRKDSGKVLGLKPVLVHNMAELSAIKKDEAAILAKVGAKKKLGLIKHADQMKIKILNLGGKAK